MSTVQKEVRANHMSRYVPSAMVQLKPPRIRAAEEKTLDNHIPGWEGIETIPIGFTTPYH